MLRLKMPPHDRSWTVSLSGGVDSLVLTHLLLSAKRKFNAIHFNHGTPNASLYQEFVTSFCVKNEINLKVCYYTGNPTEKDWAAYRRAHMICVDGYVLTAHHLDDKLESFLMGRKLEYQVRNIIRPLIDSPKQKIRAYALRKGLQWVEDSTNQDPNFCRRNKIRNRLIPMMKECGINPYSFLES